MTKGYRQDQPGWLTRDDGQAEAVRYYQSDGDAFSGWVVRSPLSPNDHSDPIPTKPEAVEALLAWNRPRTYQSDVLGAVAIPEDDPRPMAEQWAGAAAEAFDSEDSRCDDPTCDAPRCLG